MRRLLLAVVLATSGLIVPGAPVVRAVDTSTDIPGLDLLAVSDVNQFGEFETTGTIGGGVVDAVYRVELSAGNVIIVTLASGSSGDGTDLDLYLYDDSASTVVQNYSGAIIRSNGYTSEEHFTYYAARDGFVYIDVNAYNGVVGQYRLRVAVTTDTTPPTAYAAIYGTGAGITSDRRTTVSIVGTDDLSDVTAGSWSFDGGTTWSDWTPLPIWQPWTLDGPDGRKFLWAKVRDQAGNESPVKLASILLDTTAPKILSITPSSFSVARPTFTVTFDEPVTATSWESGFSIADDIGTPVTGTWSVNGNLATFAPLADFVRSATDPVVYTATISGPRDTAGNRVEPMSWTFRRLFPSSVTASSTTTKTLTYGSSLGLSGRTTPSRARVTLQGRPADSTTWRDIASVTSGDGRFSLSVRPTFTGSYRFAIASFGSYAASVSAAWKVNVRRFVAIEGSGSGVIRSATTTSDVTVSARTLPVASGIRVTLRLQQYLGGRWSTVKSRSLRTGADGKVRYVWQPTRGLWRWRAEVAGTILLVANRSAWYRWRVR